MTPAARAEEGLELVMEGTIWDGWAMEDDCLTMLL